MGLGTQATSLASVTGATIFQGYWDAGANTPTLASGVGTQGHYYVVSVPGTTNLDGETDWEIGDWAIYNGTIWQKVDNSGAGGSSFGKVGITNASGEYSYYASLTLAMAAASIGETIELFANIVEAAAVPITLKDGVNINGKGHTYSVTTTDNGFVFIDNGVAVKTKISNLIVDKSGVTTSDILNYCIYLSNAGSELDATGSQFLSLTTTALNVGTIKGGYYKGNHLAFNQPCCFTNSVAGKLINVFAEVGVVTVSPDYGMAIANGGEMYNCTIITDNAKAVRNGGYMANCSTKTPNNIIGNLHASIHNLGGTVVNCTADADSIAIYNQGGTVLNSTGRSNLREGILNEATLSNCSGYSMSYKGIYNSSSLGIVTGCTGVSASSTGLQGAAFNSVGYSSASFALGNYSSEKLVGCVGISILQACAVNGVSYTNCSFESRWNDVGGHAFVMNQFTTELVNCTFKVANVGASCIYAGTSRNLKYIGSSFSGATVPVDSNITQIATNTPDSQGNIIL